MSARYEYSPDFQAWWRIYPRKEAKARAARLFEIALKEVDINTLTEGAERYAAYVERSRKPIRFVKQPETWLSGGCWDDQLDDEKTAYQCENCGHIG